MGTSILNDLETIVYRTKRQTLVPISVVFYIQEVNVLLRTYKFRLYPTSEQQEKIRCTLKRCRLLYNRLLAERIHAYKTEGKAPNLRPASEDVPRAQTADSGVERRTLSGAARCRQAARQGVPSLLSPRQERRKGGVPTLQAAKPLRFVHLFLKRRSLSQKRGEAETATKGGVQKTARFEPQTQSGPDACAASSSRH
ncbi:hypothetical protein D7M11_35330 [Paenibacillus ginsengarvi]|uniref:Transposase putative helix-turn-helix domain-containing protein n=1 Tax=Paenibacillus ginsengarvi TaxID=400777 RepID=A0A3B0AM95_9BACL|nr:hypothetical protein D7M11_35330 [Paenibacillus ginsengarvi]